MQYNMEVFKKPEHTLTQSERIEKLELLLKSKEVKGKAFHMLGSADKAKSLLAKITQISDMYAVKSCTLKSVIDTAITIEALGLEIIPELGEAWIIGYKGKSGFQTAKPDISYKGWKKLAKRQGYAVDAEGVFTEIADQLKDWSDVFSFQYRRKVKSGNVQWVKENLEGVVVKIEDLKSRHTEYRYVDISKLDQIMKVSPSVKKGGETPYKEWYYEMVVLAKAMKYILKKEISFDENISAALAEIYKTDATAAKEIKPEPETEDAPSIPFAEVQDTEVTDVPENETDAK